VSRFGVRHGQRKKKGEAQQRECSATRLKVRMRLAPTGYQDCRSDGYRQERKPWGTASMRTTARCNLRPPCRQGTEVNGSNDTNRFCAHRITRGAAQKSQVPARKHRWSWLLQTREHVRGEPRPVGTANGRRGSQRRSRLSCCGPFAVCSPQGKRRFENGARLQGACKVSVHFFCGNRPAACPLEPFRAPARCETTFASISGWPSAPLTDPYGNVTQSGTPGLCASLHGTRQAAAGNVQGFCKAPFFCSRREYSSESRPYRETKFARGGLGASRSVHKSSAKAHLGGGNASIRQL